MEQHKPDSVNQALIEFEQLKHMVKCAIEQDRQMAVETREALIERWGQDELPSEDAAMEREINVATANVIKATDKIPKVMEAMAKVVNALVKERAFMSMAQNFREIDMGDANNRLAELHAIQQAKEVRQLDSKVEQSFIPER